jgi:predicted HD phosphohydrolase
MQKGLIMQDQFADQSHLPPPGTRHRSAGRHDAVMLASLLHLMSHYTARDEQDRPCVRLASVIERHLCALSRLPDLDPVLRATCEQLCEKWGALVDEGMPRPVKRNLFERIMGNRMANPV